MANLNRSNVLVTGASCRTGFFGTGNNNNYGGISNETVKYKRVRRRKWGKWVSEIRIPGTQERIWLGSYSTAEGEAGAHDVAAYCLQGMSCLHKMNFPEQLPPTARAGLSPPSIQKAASDAGMAIDARFAWMKSEISNFDSFGSVSSSSLSTMSIRQPEYGHYHDQMNVGEGEPLSISVDD